MGLLSGGLKVECPNFQILEMNQNEPTLIAQNPKKMATTLDVSYPTETYWETCEKSGYTWKTPKKPYAYFEFCVYGSNHCLIFSKST